MATTAQYAIGIGASAGGLEPLQEIVEALPDDLLGSALIIAQHLSPNYKSVLSELIAKKTKASVVVIGSKTELKANEIYVTPPDKHVVVKDGYLTFVRHDEFHPKPSITILLKSLADEYQDRAVGVILSGTGSDGAEGVEAIREAGGVNIVQDLKTCKYTGMPEAALRTDCVDYILSAKAIGKNLGKILNREPVSESKKPKEAPKKVDDETGVSRILELLEHKLGVDFSNYKKSTINRRLQKRMQHMKAPGVDSYLKHVVEDPEELDELFKDILIGVTKFYRDREVFDALQPILDKLVDEYAHEEEKQLRVWVAGCASGEEVYSLAIAFFETAKKKGVKNLPLQIFATDIDQKALNYARMGFYKEASLEEMPEDLIHTYFTRQDKGYMVDNRIKKCVLFSKHDVTSNPPFLKLDLISCRNLLIYFNLTLQRQVIPIFHYGLNNSGYLLLGKSESVSTFKNLFTPLDSKHKIFLKKPVEKRFYTFPQLRPKKKTQSALQNQEIRKKNLTISDMVKETVYNTFEHPYVVVDENLEMLEVHKEVSKYLKFRPGSVSTNIMKLVVGDLQLELRALAGQAVKNNTAARGRIRRFKAGRDLPYEYIRLTIKPLLFASPIMPYYLVIFEEIEFEDSLAIDLNVKDSGSHDDPRILQLEQELEATKEHMNTLVEELETSNEELQSTNEELQSSNEELQASNEELETSNEELQSTNEELEIAYTELRKATEKIEAQKEELVQSGNRLRALFNSTVQGHILLESNYNIIMFNERAEKSYAGIFGSKLVTGKSYVDYIPSHQFAQFQARFKKALGGEETKGVVEYDGDRYFIYHFIPIDKDKSIDTESVLISFHEITTEKQAEKRLQEANKQLEAQKNLWHRLFVDAPHYIAILTGENYRYEYVNPPLEKLLNKQQIIGKSIRDTISVFDEYGFSEILENVRQSEQPFHGSEYAFKFDEKSDPYYLNLTFSPLGQNDGTPDIVMYATDVSSLVSAREEIHRSHERIKIENEKLQELFDSAPLFIAVFSGPEHVFDYVNPFINKFFKGVELIGHKAENVVPEVSEQGFLQLMDKVYESGETFIGNEIPANLLDEKGRDERFFNFVFHARKSNRGETEGITLIGYEVTDQINARKALQERADYLSMLSELMPQKVFTCDPKGNNDYHNSRFMEFTGFDNETLCKDGWEKIIHPSDLEETKKHWQIALDTKEAFQLKHRIKSIDGNYIWHLTRCVPIFDQDGNIAQWIGTSTDVHEQVTSEKRKDEFLNVASHELKTPLTTIVAYTELLKALPAIKNDGLALNYVEKNLKNQLRLNKLIADLLDVTKIQSGRLNLSFREVDFNRLAHQCLENLAPTYSSHQLEFSGNVSSKVCVDESRIEQVFANLISNAVKYSPKSNKIKISISENEDSVIVSVTDFGMGIPLSKQKYIFNRFYRVDENHSTISGLGIGLYITSQIIAAHEGKIWLESIPGDGSTFYFSLPIVRERP